MKRKGCFSVMLLALPFTAAFGAAAHFTLGIPGAPVICTDPNGNAWLAANSAYAAMSVVTPGENAMSAVTVAGMPRVKLAAAEAGFVMERTKPEYYLGERITPRAALTGRPPTNGSLRMSLRTAFPLTRFCLTRPESTSTSLPAEPPRSRGC